jgi:hypothetical protein
MLKSKWLSPVLDVDFHDLNYFEVGTFVHIP